MKCPNCGSALDLDDWWQDLMKSRWGGVTCDNCPAVIRIRSLISSRARIYRDSLLSALLLVTILGSVSILILASMNLPTLIPLILTVLFFIAGFVVRSGLRMTGPDACREQPDCDAEVIRMRPTCQRCGAALDFAGALTCRRCGFEAAEGTQTSLLEEHQVEAPETGAVGTCIVCSFSLDSDDELLFCPHCGRPAHKVHLLEWLHVKNRCPSCGEQIDEEEIIKQLSE